MNTENNLRLCEICGQHGDCVALHKQLGAQRTCRACRDELRPLMDLAATAGEAALLKKQRRIVRRMMLEKSGQNKKVQVGAAVAVCFLAVLAVALKCQPGTWAGFGLAVTAIVASVTSTIAFATWRLLK